MAEPTYPRPKARTPRALLPVATSIREQATEPRRLPSALEPHAGAANSTAERAIDILLLFTDDKPLWTANEIAAHFGMPKTTVYRYVNSLRSYALIAEDKQGGFRLGSRIFPLARTAKASMSINKIAEPRMEALSAEFGEMVVLQQRIGYDIVALQRIQTPQRVMLSSTRSDLLPWPAAASAKLLLAYAPPAEQEEILHLLRPTSYTGKTLQDKAALLASLEAIRRRGHAITDEERDEGVWAVAAPIFERGLGCYSLALAGPRFRITSQKATLITRAVVAAAKTVTEDLAATDF